MQSEYKNLFCILCFILILFAPSIYTQQKLSKTKIDSIVAKGKIEIDNKDWGEAIDTFGDLLDYEPDNLIANYYYGIGQRETGISRNPIERMIRLNSAEKHFKKIISIDSSYRDTFYQLAVLQFYRRNYFEAAELAEHQLGINRNLNSASTGIFHLYDIMLVNENNDEAENFLRSRNSDYDKYFLGEFYRRTDSLSKAESIFNTIITGHAQMSLIPVYLSLVRLYVQETKYEKAEKTYWKAVDAVSTLTDAQLLLKDFEFILNKREYKILYSPISLGDLKKSMRIFWLEKNPLPSLPYNMRLIEHYKRLIYAEKNFRYDGFRFKIYDANKLEVIDHPPWYRLNKKFNDRGLIYIRFGEPDDIVTVVSENQSSNMSWLYEKSSTHPRMVFYFMEDMHAPPGYWTLVPMILIPRF